MSAASLATRRDIPPPPRAVVEALALSSKTVEILRLFGERLARANETMNLVGATTVDDFWGRHVLDCGQLVRVAPRARAWADLGSGAGFPGIVLAAMLKGEPGARVHLVESVGKRCRFLARIGTELDLPVTTHQARAETLALEVEVVTARACAPLERLLGLAEGFFGAGARGLFLKGQGCEAEISAARKTWRFDCDTLPSLSDPRGRIVSVTDLARRRPARPIGARP